VNDDVPAEVLRRRSLFEKLREEVRRLKPDTTGLNEDLTEAEMIQFLNNLEGMLEAPRYPDVRGILRAA
jgi:hypothetical protein